MKIILDNPTEEELIRKQSISIDELIVLFNKYDLDRVIKVYVDSEVYP